LVQLVKKLGAKIILLYELSGKKTF